MVDFGMRKFEVEGTQFVINGYKTFCVGNMMPVFSPDRLRSDGCSVLATCIPRG